MCDTPVALYSTVQYVVERFYSVFFCVASCRKEEQPTAVTDGGDEERKGDINKANNGYDDK